jgi:hypothetical protein
MTMYSGLNVDMIGGAGTFSFFVSVLILTVLYLFRNQRTHKFRLALIAAIGRQSDKEIHSGDVSKYLSYYAAIDSVSYAKILFVFWRPMSWHYRNTILAEMALEAEGES